MAFATTTDIAIRLQQPSLSAEEDASALALLDFASGVICEAAGKSDETWFADLPAPSQSVVKAVAVELVCRAMASPQGLTMASESLGEWSRMEEYRSRRDKDHSTALLLTPGEAALVRRAAGAVSSASARTQSLQHDVYVPVET